MCPWAPYLDASPPKTINTPEIDTGGSGLCGGFAVLQTTLMPGLLFAETRHMPTYIRLLRHVHRSWRGPPRQSVLQRPREARAPRHGRPSSRPPLAQCGSPRHAGGSRRSCRPTTSCSTWWADGAQAAMPEAAVNKTRDLEPREDDIGLCADALDRGVVDSIAQTRSTQRASKQQLRLCISACLTLHPRLGPLVGSWWRRQLTCRLDRLGARMQKLTVFLPEDRLGDSRYQHVGEQRWDSVTNLTTDRLALLANS